MARFKVIVPPTWEQGSYSAVVSDSSYRTAPQEALQDYNSCRAHDGLPPITRMPRGTKYVRLEEPYQPCALNPNRPVSIVKTPVVDVRKMSLDEAENILGNRATWEVRNMKKALSMMPILNTPEENQRLEATKVWLKYHKGG